MITYTNFSTELILEVADTLASKENTAFYKCEWTARLIYMIGFRKWKNKIMKLKLEMSIFFVNSSLEAILYLFQKVLFIYGVWTGHKIEQKITPVALQNFVATH